MGKTLIVVTGPTAVGKTSLCMDLARYFRIPIINADSRQIYKGMSIGTAAPTEEQLRQVRHYFVGMLPLDEYYSASLYEQQATALLDDLFKEHDLALMSGGSMMYIDAVCNGIDDIPTVDEETRSTMKRRLATEGLEALCEELRQLDPEHYAIVDRKNPRRVVHALEICHMTGRTYTSFRKGAVLANGNGSHTYSSGVQPMERCNAPRQYSIVKIGLTRQREEIYERINRRVDAMMQNGLLDEARQLLPLRHANALNTVGYKEMFAYLDGKWTLDEAVERMKGNTRRYARKQLTWLKKDPGVTWMSPDDKNLIISYIENNGL